MARVKRRKKVSFWAKKGGKKVKVVFYARPRKRNKRR